MDTGSTKGCRIRVRGLVQGVGFRPYVWRLARELGLSGWVRNDGAGVEIAIRGPEAAVESFLARLPREAPRLARIDTVEAIDLGEGGDSLAAPDRVDPHGCSIYGPDAGSIEAPGQPAGAPDFVILESGAGPVATAIGPDAAVCPDCVADFCDPAGRRWRYAFTTCTHCGPRFTVSRGIPYDRARTSLAPFPLCPACAAEYADPADRRFHAETTACPACGPRLALLDGAGRPLAGGDPIAATLALLRAGKIVALKGLGGFHLACDGRNAAAVAELRGRKHRDDKPFAVMALNPASLADFARIGEAEAALLARREAPIVLCPKGGAELAGVAPGLAWLGALLPATPLHLLLWHEAAGRPAGTGWLAEPHELLLVMTSANPHGEPLVIGNDEACERLAGIADAFLLHDREIVVRCDDSVAAPAPASPRLIRRARGWTPVPIALAEDGPPVLAFGAYLKNTVCVFKGRQAFLSQHIGGLDNAAAIGFLEETVAHLLAILEVEPALVAHDLHPDYPSSRLAAAFAAGRGVPAVAVGHHHAHIAAILAEAGFGGEGSRGGEAAGSGPVLGLALDGVGLGADGGAWGGELLRVDGADCRRLGHLSPLLLPGGDRAAREPWRLAASALLACGRGDEIPAFIARRHPGRDGALLARMLERGFNCPPTSSLGRLFDAAAGLLGLRSESRYEGQAAMELEGLAARHGPAVPLAGGYVLGQAGILDFSPLIAFLADCGDAPLGAATFHATVAAGLAEWAGQAALASGLDTVACGGGCAMNGVLMAALRLRLEERGIRLLEARLAPPNDGGIALGQGWVARRHENMKNVV